MSSRLEGKVAIVTGGASGFGEAFTHRFVAEGARVVIADLDGDRGEAVAAAARASGGEAAFVQADVTRGGDGHPYADAWWPDSHGLGYEHGFVNQAADIVRAISRRRPELPLPDFADAYETQRVMEAAVQSARTRGPVRLSEVR